MVTKESAMKFVASEFRFLNYYPGDDYLPRTEEYPLKPSVNEEVHEINEAYLKELRKRGKGIKWQD